MLRFSIETAVGGCEGSRCETAGAAMLAYGPPMVAHGRIGAPLGSEIIGPESHCNGGVKVALGGRFVALCQGEVHSESCKSHCNGCVKVVGLRCCARGKCIERVANRIVMVVSRWLWVVGLRRCAREKCMHCNGGVKVALGGRFAALCQGEVHAHISNRIVMVV